MLPHSFLVALIFTLTVLGFAGVVALANRPLEQDEPQQHEEPREPDEVPLEMPLAA